MSGITDMRTVCQLRRPNAKGKMIWAGHWFNSRFTRYISIYFTWVFVRLGVSANAVTFMMIPLGLGGAALLVPHNIWANLAGFVLLMLAVIFDCVDGEVARWNKKSSVRGFYLDLIYHVICHAPVYMLCALHLYALWGDTTYLILAFVTYAAANCAQSLGIVYYLVQTKLPSVSKSASASGASPQRSRIAQLRHAGGFFFDKMVTEFVVVAGILLTYAGLMWPIIVLAWVLAVRNVLWMTLQTVHRYFYSVPEVAHQKATV